jgi:RNA 2',3'-cyclic 3'-phosphodiesterase
VKPLATVEDDAPLRLFLALELPESVGRALVEWGRRELPGTRRIGELHVTLAFLGAQPRTHLQPILAVLREEAGRTHSFELEPVRYRETRSVAMLVLADPSGRATGLADRLQQRLEALGVYEREQRPWLPHVTVARFRERPRLAPHLPEIARFAPSGAAAFLSRLRATGARYEVVESCSLENGKE